MTHQVFISYARRDGSQLAARLDRDLQAVGYSTWRDVRSIDPYQDFSGEIEAGIRSAELVVVCITPSVESRSTHYGPLFRKAASWSAIST